MSEKTFLEGFTEGMAAQQEIESSKKVLIKPTEEPPKLKGKPPFIFFSFLNILWGLVICFVAWTCSPAKAQQPVEPDVPFVPYFDIAELCTKEIAINEWVEIQTTCWEKTEMIKDEDGNALYIYVPPGCIAVARHQTRRQIDVYQDDECYILLWDKTKLEEEEAV